MPKNRSIVILAISLAVLLGTECGIPFPSRTKAPASKPIEQSLNRYRFVLPDNYIGWVRIDVGVPKAEPWEFKQGSVTATIPESGVTQTQSALDSAAEVLLYYQRADRLVSVRRGRYPHYVNPTEIVVTHKDGRWVTQGSWYFFAGPYSLKGDYSFNVPPHSKANLPTPGRMAAPPETQPPTGPN
jgi:hypothetical protein